MNLEKLKNIYQQFMDELGVDWSDENNVDTPMRVAKYFRKFLTEEQFVFTKFPAEKADEMVIVKDIPFYSLCAHHHLPFFGVAHVAYIPGEEIIGLSKLARVVDLYAGNFQNQERLTTQVADRLQLELNPKGVAVMLTAEHMCMSIRGVKKHGAKTTTTKLLGVFKTNPDARAEFLNSI